MLVGKLVLVSLIICTGSVVWGYYIHFSHSPYLHWKTLYLVPCCCPQQASSCFREVWGLPVVFVGAASSFPTIFPYLVIRLLSPLRSFSSFLRMNSSSFFSCHIPLYVDFLPSFFGLLKDFAFIYPVLQFDQDWSRSSVSLLSLFR